ncbi:circularly permutated Ras protein 1-like isoform X2 [Antedon mediterranea]|uniref:circularly permutated Ras protein 1-like isoform X2 n=1 Tax=Antedon mediterranea TaxID=105859 RepID=UPI003AF71EBA
MEFASSHVLNYDDSDDEFISEGEYKFGIGGSAKYAATAGRTVAPGGRSFVQSEGNYDNIGLVGQQSAPSEEAIYDNRTFDGPEAIYDNKIPSKNKPKVPEGLYAELGAHDSHHYSELSANAPPLPPENIKKTKEEIKPMKYRRADTNVVAVKFESLVKSVDFSPGEAIFCENCSAAFSHISKIIDGQFWKCEFCEAENISEKFAIQDKLEKDDVTYILKEGSGTEADSAILFCLDISGSMCVTTEVNGNDQLMRSNDANVALMESRKQFDEPRYVSYPGATVQPKTYISRLQAMQSAIDTQLTRMEREQPDKRVGIVAFNNRVIVVGDGSNPPVILHEEQLLENDVVVEVGRSIPLPAPISQVKRCLADKVFSLNEVGQTALGPALLVSIAMASQRPGSKVIVCTDGMANIGLGSLLYTDTEYEYEAASVFYQEAGKYACANGVSVSVLTMEGEDCRVIELGSVADATGGQVNIVQPNNLSEEFGSILQDPILACKVSAKLILHKGMYFRNEDTEGSVVSRNIGNVTSDSEATFEFGVRKKPVMQVLYDNLGGTMVDSDQAAEEPIYDTVMATSAIEGLERLPFQLQIRYTTRTGSECLRIITMDRPVTKDRQFAEQNLNVAVLGTHAAQSTAKLAVDGLYGEARLNAIVTQKLVERHVQQKEEDDEGIYQTFVSNLAPIDSELNRVADANNQEMNASPSEEEEATSPKDKKAKKKSKKGKIWRKKVTDRSASIFYKTKNVTGKDFYV